jgi:hypothetical protein
VKHIQLFETFKIWENQEGETLWYQKCEGGDGIIDPSSFERTTLGGISSIKFINDDAKKYGEINSETGKPDSESINNCLGGDPKMPLTGRFFETKFYGIGGGIKREYASFELDNSGKPV